MSYKQQETRPARRAVRLHRLLLTWPQGTAARPGQHLTALTPGSEPPCAVLGAEEAPPQLLTSLGVGGQTPIRLLHHHTAQPMESSITWAEPAQRLSAVLTSETITTPHLLPIHSPIQRAP